MKAALLFWVAKILVEVGLYLGAIALVFLLLLVMTWRLERKAR